MIATLTGKIVSIENHDVILDVRGVGYEILLGSHFAIKLEAKLGEIVTIFTAMIVRENEISLVGFEDKISKKIFMILLSLHGIGVKVALAIVDQLSLEQISIAVKNKEYRLFAQIKGIGQKTAQKILLELESKLENFSHCCCYQNNKSRRKN